ncbi:hypothetical protein FNV43_RR00710 [Rhamnella rubrinervis]|uniref:Uncharacterized protein n=1 Tax=Rhamnella rubrinervis TaxID=2594499 RepID=A0A8K0MRN0_9ROSA|nr:hypothetical protein FNV43_RR00710 [Rhamnella rubrinervis]
MAPFKLSLLKAPVLLKFRTVVRNQLMKYTNSSDSDGKLERIPIADFGGESLFSGKLSTGISVLASELSWMYAKCDLL